MEDREDREDREACPDSHLDRLIWINEELHRMQRRTRQLESLKFQLCNEVPLETLENLYSPTFASGILTEKPEDMLLPRPQLSKREASPCAAWNEEVQRLVREERMLEEKRGVVNGLSTLQSRDDLLAFYGSPGKVADYHFDLYNILRRRQEAIETRLREFGKLQGRVRYEGAGTLPLQRLRHLTIREANDVLHLAYVRVRDEVQRQAKLQNEQKKKKKKKKGHTVSFGMIGRDHHGKLRDQFLAVLGERAYRYRAMHKDRILLCGWRKCKRFSQGM